MRLVSLNDHPDWIKVFSELHLRFLKGEEQKYFLFPDKIEQLLKLDFNVPKEAFFFEDDSGDFFGGIFLTGSVTDKKRGHFSLFSYSPDTKHQKNFSQVWSLIEKWFKDYGMTEVVGPYIYTTYFPYRFRSDDIPEKHIWEPNQPLFYNDLMLSAGMKVDESYYSKFIENYGVFATKGEAELEAATANGFRFREISNENISEEIKIIYKISMESFKDNYLFTPIPFELFEKLYAPSFMDMDLRLACIIEDAKGSPIGLNFTFPLNNYLVIKSAATIPQYRGQGLFNASIRWSMLRAFKLFPEIKNVSMALFDKVNSPIVKLSHQSESATLHEYRLYKKVLK